MSLALTYTVNGTELKVINLASVIYRSIIIFNNLHVFYIYSFSSLMDDNSINNQIRYIEHVKLTYYYLQIQRYQSKYRALITAMFMEHRVHINSLFM